MKRLVSSSNALVLSAVTVSDARFRSRIVRHWLKSLYIYELIYIVMMVEIACSQFSNLVRFCSSHNYASEWL